jgi:predicted O-linked N-acetylglucosamine transferase (SPINDLY family)
MALGQLGAAVASYQAAIRHNPRLAQAHHSLGNAQRQQGDLGAAGQSLRRAVEINPGYAAAHNSLALLLLQAGGQSQAAADSFERAISLQPDFAEAHFHLGKLLSEASRAEAAVAHYQLALRSKPDFAEAHSNLGNALKAIGRWDEALASYARALQLKADFPQAQRNLAQALKDVGRLDQAAALLQRAIELEPLDLSTRSDLLFLRNLQPGLSGEQRLAEAREFGALATQRVQQAQPFTPWPNSPDPKRCLRVGLVSADLRQHPVGYFTQSVIASMAALAGPAGAAVELLVYSNHPEPDPDRDRVSAQIAAHCKTWTPVQGMTDAQLAARVRSDGIDVLIDLSGHTGGNRLPMFACKPAPLQISWLGYCASTGLAAMDYFMADRWIAPPAAESEFTERLLRLPETFLCFTPPEVNLAISELPALTRGGLTFGCFNNLAKLNDQVLALWAQILLALPNSRLFLKAAPLADPVIAAGLLKRFAALGVGPERLLLEGTQARADYLAAYHRVDIALDPFPYPGGTTSVEALWMGVPVLSLQAGSSALARQGESILQNCGLADWLARDAPDYLRLALHHAADLPALAALRLRLRQQLLDSPLCDAPGFARHLEAALREAWVGWCAGQVATS